ncbi:MAG TPA: acetaldehyde dehydrogenase (acetylating) [Actinomycetes bacterium]
MALRVAILGSGNIGTDLLYKAARNPALALVGMAGIDPASEGLARARAAGFAAGADGVERFLDDHPDLDLVFDATSAHAHAEHAPLLAARELRCIDLTPAALGPAVVPDVNLDEHLGATDVNLVTCGAQATVPVVAALSAAAPVAYAEVVSTVASRSAGPGTRSNIDEFTVATARSLEALGGAAAGKAIIILNPAEPPITMRNTIYAETALDAAAASAAVAAAVGRVAAYVPGYRLAAEPLVADGLVTVFVQVEGAGDYLPAYAGNLDIMTSAAVRVAERYAERFATT